jgi:hypothetical protein
MSIWPYIIGRFVELPYTLAQDCTLTVILGEKSPHIWLQKVDFIEKYCGMVLLNTHPDYLVDPVTWNIYAELLQAMKNREAYWHALPRDVARWWRARTFTPYDSPLRGAVQGQVKLGAQGILLDLDGKCV